MGKRKCNLQRPLLRAACAVMLLETAVEDLPAAIQFCSPSDDLQPAVGQIVHSYVRDRTLLLLVLQWRCATCASQHVRSAHRSCKAAAGMNQIIPGKPQGASRSTRLSSRQRTKAVAVGYICRCRTPSAHPLSHVTSRQRRRCRRSAAGGGLVACADSGGGRNSRRSGGPNAAVHS